MEERLARCEALKRIVLTVLLYAAAAFAQTPSGVSTFHCKKHLQEFGKTCVQWGGPPGLRRAPWPDCPGSGNSLNLR